MIDYATHLAPIGTSIISDVWDLVQVCFDPRPDTAFYDRVNEKLRPFVVVARNGKRAVGFKLGYERTPEEFYSWLGGVHPDFRRQGVATQLMLLQHQQCRKLGYKLVTTEALNENPAMLTLNLAHKFRIVGTRVDNRGLKILMTRNLDEAAP
jgi:ribosomal protein S18 acetylase RimI-like enzyme